MGCCSSLVRLLANACASWATLLQERQNLLVENTYVRVYGSFKGKNDEGPSDRLGYINAFAVRPVEDHNEVCAVDTITEVLRK